MYFKIACAGLLGVNIGMQYYTIQRIDKSFEKVRFSNDLIATNLLQLQSVVSKIEKHVVKI